MKNRIPTFFWIILSLSILIIATSIAYYFLWFLPNKEKIKYDPSQVEQTEGINREDKETQIRQNCYEEAVNKSREKLEKLIEADLITQSEKEEYKKALDAGLTRKEDRDYYFDLCLTINGLK
jgi:hypothetical protein